MIYKMRFYILAFSVIFMGCRIDTDSNSNTDIVTPPDTNQTNYYAQDILRRNLSLGMFYVDLSSHIGSFDGTKVALNQVTDLTSDVDCHVLSQNSSGFLINTNRAQVCDYRYRVGPAISTWSKAMTEESYAEATIRVVTGKYSDLLTPLSAITSSAKPVSINLKEELHKSGYEIGEQFNLSPNVILPSATITNSEIMINLTAQEITYTPGPGVLSGVERILYSYEDVEGHILAGTIDVSISTESNRAPIAQSVKLREILDPVTGNIRETVPWNKTVEIDVAPLIRDPDGDALQLVEVFVYGANATLPYDKNNDEMSFDATVFRFSSIENGTKDISYTVSDLKGGYATGVIEVVIDGPYQKVGDLTPPHLALQAVGFGAEFKSHGPGDGITALKDVINATFDFERAKAVCATQGRYLPSLEDFEYFYSVLPEGSLFAKHNWPVDLPYWAFTDQGTLINMQSGDITHGESDEYAYVSCSSTLGVENVEISNLDELNAAIIPGMIQRPLLLVTYWDGSREYEFSEIYHFEDPSIAHYVDGKIIAQRVGETRVSIDYGRFTVDYLLQVVEPDLVLSGGWVLTEGEQQPVTIKHRTHSHRGLIDIGVDNLISSDNSTVDILQDGTDFFAKGMNLGKARLLAKQNLNGFEYSVKSDATVFVESWCYRYAVDRSSKRVCLGYDPVVVADSGIVDLLDKYYEAFDGYEIHGPNLYEYCNRFALEPYFNTTNNTIFTVQNDTIGKLNSAVSWIGWNVDSDLKPIIAYGFAPKPSENDSRFQFIKTGNAQDVFGVPLCIVPQNKVKARIID